MILRWCALRPAPASSRPQPLPESALLANTLGSPFQGRCFPTELADAVTGPGFDRRGIAAVSECIDEPMTRFLVFSSALTVDALRCPCEKSGASGWSLRCCSGAGRRRAEQTPTNWSEVLPTTTPRPRDRPSIPSLGLSPWSVSTPSSQDVSGAGSFALRVAFGARGHGFGRCSRYTTDHSGHSIVGDVSVRAAPRPDIRDGKSARPGDG